jgi:hypothetical protein
MARTFVTAVLRCMLLAIPGLCALHASASADCPTRYLSNNAQIQPGDCGNIVYNGSIAATVALPAAGWKGTFIDLGPGVVTLVGGAGTPVNGSTAGVTLVAGSGGTVAGDPATGWQWSGPTASFNALGNLAVEFGGLQFAVAPGSLSNPVTAGTGYAVGDQVTAACSGVTFSTAPIIGVTAVSAGAVTSYAVVNPGVTSSAPASGGCGFTQASTTGSGSGLTFTASFGLIAASLSAPALSTGGTGGANGSLFIGGEQPYTGSGGFGGDEDTFIGGRAGSGFYGTSSFNTALGHNSGGQGTSKGAAQGNSNTFVGDDAGRNIQGSVQSNTCVGQASCEALNAATGNVAVGYAAGTVTTSGGNTYIGYKSGLIATSSANNVCLGNGTCEALTTGSGSNLILGHGVANGTLATGVDNILLGTGTNCDTPATNTNYSFMVCANTGSTPLMSGSAQSTSLYLQVNGPVAISTGYTVSTLPSSAAAGEIEGAHAYVTDATSCSFLGSLTGGGSTFCPVIYNGSSWVAE